MLLVDGVRSSQNADPTSYHPMHSFFQHVPTERQSLASGRSPQSTINQDSRLVRNESVNELDPIEQKNSVTHTHGGCKESRSGQSSNDLKGMLAYDVLGDRSKRRRLSVEHKDDPVSSATAEGITAHTTQPEQNLNQLRDTSLATSRGDNISGDVSQSIHPSMPKRRRGRPTNSKTTPQKQFVQASNDSTEPAAQDLVATGQAFIQGSKRTPRKKTMQVSSSGKLVTDPVLASSGCNDAKEGNRFAPPPVQKGKKLLLKNGKFAQSMIVRIKYTDKVTTGQKIDDVLAKPILDSDTKSKHLHISNTEIQGKTSNKTTHPFFIGKPIHRPTTDALAIAVEDEKGSVTSDRDEGDIKKPVAWKDIVFKPNRPAISKDFSLHKPAWPPSIFQRVVPPDEGGIRSVASTSEKKQKTKDRTLRIGEDEEVMRNYTRSLLPLHDPNPEIYRPRRLCMSGRDAINTVYPEETTAPQHKAIAIGRAKALNCLSYFDRAHAPGPLPWTQQHGPLTWDEVLQPSCQVLYDWLRGLAVHNVKQGIDEAHSRQVKKRKKKQKRHEDELDDFIVDDDDMQDVIKIKNAILIVGPNGCGKTASVYAVSRQLGFEVFEIHAGMRRNQKDIFDKVGDMTQNHMVQGGQAPMSRDSSILNEIEPPPSPEQTAQSSATNFFGGGGKKRTLAASRPATPQPTKEQKQSLVLFEEVDQIFDDDRGFWSAVQSLIQSSKRPVVLTCNDMHNIPLEELDLYTVLRYEAPEVDVVTESLAYLTMSEGHLVKPSAIESLYRSKGHDLRATITELDFWCQMAVGSCKGGLDWLPETQPQHSVDSQHRSRVFSEDTFRAGLDLLPTGCRDLEDDFVFAQECLDISMDELLEHNYETLPISEAMNCMELMSDAETLHVSMRPFLYGKLRTSDLLASRVNATQLARLVIAQRQRSHAPDKVRFGCLEPLGREKPTFPPSQGHLAPSLELPRSVLATDIAPYVRTIASFDLKLGQQREEQFSSQGKKSRTTRAARAAAEGGDKATTRRERWFPHDLDLQAVLGTGSDWPQWYEDLIMQDTMESSP